MAESDDEYETRMLRETVPRGLRSDYGAPPRERAVPPHDHLLGSEGEGRDKSTVPSNAPTNPIVNGDPDNNSTSGTAMTLVVVENGVGHYVSFGNTTDLGPI